MGAEVYFICALCDAHDTGHITELGAKGWDWFTGYFSKRVEVCPSCMGSRRDERNALFVKSRAEEGR